MTRNTIFTRTRNVGAIAATLLSLGGGHALRAGTTAFTYQGRLDDNGSAATGLYDLQFTLLGSDGKAVGSPVVLTATPVAAGVFSAVLDFGEKPFDGSDRWLQVGVRTNGAAGAFVPVNPATRVTPVPYAMVASAALSYAGPVSDAQLPQTVARLGVSGQSFPGFTSFDQLGVGGAGPIFPLTIKAQLPDTNDYLGFVSTDGTLRWHLTGFGGGLNFAQSGKADFRLFLSPGGQVGINNGLPAATLDVVGTFHTGNTLGSFDLNNVAGAEGTALLGSFSGNNGLAPQLRFKGVGNGAIDVGQNKSGDFVVETSDVARLVVTQAGTVGIGTASPSTTLDVRGEVTCTAVNITSDRAAKTGFQRVDPREVLEKVARIPITRWQYKSDASASHIGPMAQDFHAAFGLGHDERHIASVDEDGVALAAIQGLNEKLGEKDAEIARLRAENEAMAGRLGAIERALGLAGGK